MTFVAENTENGKCVNRRQFGSLLRFIRTYIKGSGKSEGEAEHRWEKEKQRDMAITEWREEHSTYKCADYASHVFRSCLLLSPMKQMDKRLKLPQDLCMFFASLHDVIAKQYKFVNHPIVSILSQLRDATLMVMLYSLDWSTLYQRKCYIFVLLLFCRVAHVGGGDEETPMAPSAPDGRVHLFDRHSHVHPLPTQPTEIHR